MTLFRPLLALVLLMFLTGCEQDLPALKIGVPAPAFALDRLDGASVRFPEQYRNQVVVLRFWADWCPYCANSMTQIDRLQREHAASGLVVLAVNVAQDRATAAAFVAQLGVGYPALLDPDSKITRQYGVQGLPITYFIDREGRIGGKILGEADQKLLMSQLNRILPPAR